MTIMKLLSAHINQSPVYTINQPIHFVATKDEWMHCEARLRNAKIIGLDTETRPVFSKNMKSNPCSLLQIAVRDTAGKEEVFVLDLLKLPAKVYNNTISDVFLSKKIIKLGQGFYQDLKELSQSYPKASCFRVTKNVVEVNDLSISLVGAHHQLSLQKLVFLYLHKRLTKTQQTSNWNRRPLSSGQLHYAAADALVLIHLYDKLMHNLLLRTPTFCVSSISSVLDVDVVPAPKCTLCFEVFESLGALKTHRKVCCKDVRTLEICATCNVKQLWTTEAMEQHTLTCGVDEERPEPPIKKSLRKRSLSIESTGIIAATGRDPVGIAKKKQRQEDSTVDLVEAPVTATDILTSGKKEKKIRSKKKKSRNPRTLEAMSEKAATTAPSMKVRKMSMESSLLASDAMWSQISIDHSSQ